MLLLLVISCTAVVIDETTTTTPVTTTLPTTTTTRAPAVDECPPAPYQVDFLPINVNGAGFDPSGVEPDA